MEGTLTMAMVQKWFCDPRFGHERRIIDGPKLVDPGNPQLEVLWVYVPLISWLLRAGLAQKHFVLGRWLRLKLAHEPDDVTGAFNESFLIRDDYFDLLARITCVQPGGIDLPTLLNGAVKPPEKGRKKDARNLRVRPS